MWRVNLNVILIVLGSGGHTAEMISLAKAMNLRHYVPRYYNVGACDKLSLEKAKNFDLQILKDFQFLNYEMEVSHYSKIHRSRKVDQSIIASFFTTLYAFIHPVIQILYLN